MCVYFIHLGKLYGPLIYIPFQVQQYTYKVATWLRHEGYQPGDCVALYMMGCPEYVCWWLGMARVSVVPALINFNLRNESLVHCINVAKAKAVVYGTELTECKY